MRKFLVFAFVLAFIESYAQEAIIKEVVTEVECNADATACTQHHRITVVINNENADDYASFSIHEEKGCSQLTEFHGEYKNAAGKVVKKVKKGDLTMSELSSEFKTNGYTLFYDFTPPTYPFTVTYEWTEETKNTVTSLGALHTFADYDVSVEHASYHLIVPKSVEVMMLRKNCDAEVKMSETKDGKNEWHVSVDNLPALKREQLSLPLKERLPAIYFQPKNFTCYGTKGSFESWKTLGQWFNTLVDRNETLPEELKSKLHQMADTCQSEHGKIQQAYNLLRNTTRYISIQLGIGGLQPAKAFDTATLGMGDCKGLTVLMKTFLEELGIKSYPVIIDTNDRHFERDYPSLWQGNHMILCVPQTNDSLWVECTNPKLPLGYVHEDIAGHDAVVLAADGGEFVTLPEYKAEENLNESNVNLTFSEDGSVNMKGTITTQNNSFETFWALTFCKSDEQRNIMLNLYDFGQAEFQSFDVKTIGAKVMVDMDLNINKYATHTGNRLFIPVNPIRRDYSSLAAESDRKSPIQRTYIFKNTEHITINIPDGYTIESLPKDVNLDNDYGTFTLKVTKTDTIVTFDYCRISKRGIFPKEQFPAYRDFTKQIASAYKQKLILKSK